MQQEKYKKRGVRDQTATRLILVAAENPFLAAENAVASIRKAGRIGKQLRGGKCKIFKWGLGGSLLGQHLPRMP